MVDRERKRELLSHLITSGRIEQALVFTRTKHGANRLAQQLERDGIAATAIHGNKSQPQRVRALADFKAGKFTVLVATEVAARGLDIEALPHVVNYELPMVPEDYVHRIGRTGRAGVDGDAVSLVCVDELGLLADIERVLGRAIPRETIAGFEPDPRIRPSRSCGAASACATDRPVIGRSQARCRRFSPCGRAPAGRRPPARWAPTADDLAAPRRPARGARHRSGWSIAQRRSVANRSAPGHRTGRRRAVTRVPPSVVRDDPARGSGTASARGRGDPDRATASDRREPTRGRSTVVRGPTGRPDPATPCRASGFHGTAIRPAR
jgi:ATP-dependent RNA helicase RhlE